MISMDNELIYYGTPNVRLYPVTGNFYKFTLERIKQPELTEESAKEVLKLLDDLSYIKKEYAYHHFSCIPETLIHLEMSEENKEEVPEMLVVPLIKLPTSSEDAKVVSYPGIMSGHRSAVMKGKSGEFYRLKGCGNDLEGFVVQKMAGFLVDYSIRGAQYEHTSARELYYSGRVQAALKPHKINVFTLIN